MTQDPTPGPLSVGQEETIAFNLCAVHGFDPDFVKTQRDFALAVIREYEVVCRPRLAPTAPVEASGSEIEVDDDHLPFDMALDLLCTADDMAVYAGAGSENVAWVARHAKERLAALRPQPSGETREAVARIIDPSAFLFSPDELPKGSRAQFDAFDRTDRILALLSASPLALGGQHSTATDFPPDDVLACEANLSATNAELLEQALSHPPLSTTPARAEAQDEGAAGELKPCPFCGGEAWLNDYEAKYSDLPPMSRAPQCRSCGASLGYLTTPAKATEAWNRRVTAASATAAEARADRLAKVLETLEAERKRDGVNLAHLKRAVAVAYADTARAAQQQEKQP